MLTPDLDFEWVLSERWRGGRALLPNIFSQLRMWSIQALDHLSQFWRMNFGTFPATHNLEIGSSSVCEDGRISLAGLVFRLGWLVVKCIISGCSGEHVNILQRGEAVPWIQGRGWRGKSAKGKCGNGWTGGSVSLVRVERYLHVLHYFLLLTREGGGGCWIDGEGCQEKCFLKYIHSLPLMEMLQILGLPGLFHSICWWIQKQGMSTGKWNDSVEQGSYLINSYILKNKVFYFFCTALTPPSSLYILWDILVSSNMSA